MSPTEPKGPVGGRVEVGDSRSSRKHPPHLDENAEDAPLQNDHPAPNDVPPLPATAHGEDTLPPDAQEEPIDEESMYERRRDEDKHRPPSTRKG